MIDAQTTAEELNLFETFYQGRVAEVAGGAVLDDGEELAIARDILLAVVDDGLTPDAAGGVSYVRRGALDWTDPTTLQAARATTGSGPQARAGGQGQPNQADLIQGVLIMGVALLVAAWFLWPAAGNESEDVEPADRQRQLMVDTGVTPTPLPTLEAQLLADIVEASGVKTDLVVPRTLEVGGVSFVVQPVTIRAGDWPLPDDERAVSWVYGTVINYVLGLEATPANKALLASVRPGDELLLRMSTGPAYRFALADAVRVAPQASEVFRQTRPGLTLTLLGDADPASRIVLRATYLPESELGLALPEAAETVPLGQPAPLAQAVRLTCLAAELLTAAAPPGYRYLRVDYRLEHSGSGPLATGAFNHHVRAGELTYGPVSPAEQWPTYPALPAQLQAGQVVTTTAVYALPETALAGPPLTWAFTTTPGGPGVSVELPLPGRPPGAEVTLQATSRPDSGTLLLSLEIRSALRQLMLTAADLHIEGATLSPAGNFFPWQVAASEAGQFNLLLAPDGSGRLTVALLEHGFEITY
jgi:hypothetical protein